MCEYCLSDETARAMFDIREHVAGLLDFLKLPQSTQVDIFQDNEGDPSAVFTIPPGTFAGATDIASPTGLVALNAVEFAGGDRTSVIPQFTTSEARRLGEALINAADRLEKGANA